MSLQEKPVTVGIRAAQADDCAAIAVLALQLGYETSGEQIRQRLGSARESEQQTVLVAEVPGGGIAGWIAMYVYRPVTNEPRLEISGFVVDESRRSQCIGAKLLEAAERFAVAQGLREVGLHCNVIRERAHEFYQRHGYHAAKVQKVFIKRLS